MYVWMWLWCVRCVCARGKQASTQAGGRDWGKGIRRACGDGRRPSSPPSCPPTHPLPTDPIQKLLFSRKRGNEIRVRGHEIKQKGGGAQVECFTRQLFLVLYPFPFVLPIYSHHPQPHSHFITAHTYATVLQGALVPPSAFHPHSPFPRPTPPHPHTRPFPSRAVRLTPFRFHVSLPHRLTS